MTQFEFIVKAPTTASYVGEVQIEAESLELAITKLKELDIEKIEVLVFLGKGWSIETNEEYNSVDIFHGNALIESKTHVEDVKTVDEVNLEILRKIEELASTYFCTEQEQDYVDNQWEDGIPFEGGMSTSEAIIHIKNVLKTY